MSLLLLYFFVTLKTSETMRRGLGAGWVGYPSSLLSNRCPFQSRLHPRSYPHSCHQGALDQFAYALTVAVDGNTAVSVTATTL